MEAWAVVLLVFTVVTAVIVLVAVLANQRVKAGIKLPGRAEFYINTDRDWQQAPPRQSGSPQPRAPSARPRFYLEMKLQRGSKWVYPLDGKAQVYVGRGADNALRLNDPAADKRQAVIYWEDGRYKINNLSSKVPTRVNGKLISKQNLGNGNTIQLGRTRFIFRDKSKKR